MMWTLWLGFIVIAAGVLGVVTVAVMLSRKRHNTYRELRDMHRNQRKKVEQELRQHRREGDDGQH